MPNVSVEELGNLTAQVTITVPFSEYEKPVSDELKKYRKTATFKGFRPGKAPMSFISKMYGQQVMANYMNKALQDAMMEYLEDKDIFGQPVPVDQVENFDLKSKEDYNFVFEIGFEPEFELTIPEASFDLEVIKSDDKYLDREIKEIRHRQGEVTEEGEEVSSKNDVLKIKLQELEGDAIKEGGVTSETYVSLDLFGNDALIEQVMGLKPGDTFEAKYTDLTKEFTEERIKKYILKLEKDAEGNYPEFNEMFRAEILSIRQVKLAELNQAFFDAVIGKDEATNEEEFRAKLGERIAKYLQSEADARWFVQVQKALLEANKVEFPEAFLKKWLLFRNENMTEKEAEEEMPSFLESLIWMLIKSKIQKAHNLEINPDSVKNAIKNQFRQYMQGQANEEMLDMFADNILDSDDEKTAEMRERAYQDALTEVVAEKLKELTNNNEIELTTSEFDEILTKAYEAKQEEEAAAAAAEVAAQLETEVEATEVEEVVAEADLEEMTADVDTEVENLAEEADEEVKE
jgi:trigger factor